MEYLKRDLTFKKIDLFLVSTLALYFEILFIRWFPANVQIVAYFTNLILISAFLGLGLGCLFAKDKYDLMPYFPFAILTLTVIGVGFSRLPISLNTKAEHFLGEFVYGGHNYITLLLTIFIFNTLFFVIIGQALGKALGYFRPLVAYSINIAGSIFGVVLFWLLSSFYTTPIVWFALGIVLSLWFVVKTRKSLVLGIFFLILALCLIGQFSGRSLWSPYYRIDTTSIFNRVKQLIGYEISVNQIQHQYAFDFSNREANFYLLDNFREIYKFPYNFVQPKEVLVIGAGSGNDVLVAIESGAEKVDAVEIDPIIGAMGEGLHPQKPYLNKNVNLFIDDGRSYLNKTDKKYDLIIFGYLDAHRLLSRFSTVRLDNFIYTLESFKEAKKHLKPEGMLVVTYRVFRDWIAGRLQNELEDVFKGNVVAYETGTYRPKDTVIFLAVQESINEGTARNQSGEDSIGGVWFLAGPYLHKMKSQNFQKFALTDRYSKIDISPATDDWPYLYLRKRTLPAHYIIVLICILGLSILLIYSFLKDRVQRLRHYHFFFLGAAFMLMETKSITRFSLLYGSTWVVNTAVITSILFMILLANFVASRIRSYRLEPYYILLAISVILEWTIDTSTFLVFHSSTSLILSSMLLALPLFFAGIIFAKSFKETDDPAGAFAFNLAGAVLGGAFEYSAMIVGFKSLSFIVLAVYAASYISFRKRLI